jgi:hypothetical protein
MRQYVAQLPVAAPGTVNEVQRISDEAGLEAIVSGDCETSPLPPNLTAMYEACSATGVINGYNVEVRVLKLSEDDPERIVQFRLSSVKNR